MGRPGECVSVANSASSLKVPIGSTVPPRVRVAISHPEMDDLIVAISRIRVLLGGWPGQPGYLNFYSFGGPAASQAAITTLLTAIKAMFPSGMTYTVPNSGDEVAETTGDLVGGWSGGTQQVITGTGTGSYSAPAGFQILWRSASVVDGHRPIGRTIIVPAAGNVHDTDGSITSTALTTINTAVNALLAGSHNLIIWHRPKYTGKGADRVLVRPGSYVTPTAGAASDKMVVLRSRRP